jgi:hypothetical protein
MNPSNPRAVARRERPPGSGVGTPSMASPPVERAPVF